RNYAYRPSYYYYRNHYYPRYFNYGYRNYYYSYPRAYYYNPPYYYYNPYSYYQTAGYSYPCDVGTTFSAVIGSYAVPKTIIIDPTTMPKADAVPPLPREEGTYPYDGGPTRP